MKKLSGFIAGVLFTLIVISTFTPALAEQVKLVFNSVNISVGDKIISRIGENYTLANGQSTYGSLTFNGTTYLPIRKIAESLNLEVDYDNQTKTVILLTTNQNEMTENKGEKMNNIKNEESIIPIYDREVPTSVNNQEDFRLLWTILYNEVLLDGVYGNYAIFRGSMPKEDFKSLWLNISLESIQEYSEALAKEKQQQINPEQELTLIFVWADGILGTATCYSDETTTSDFNPNPFN